MKAQGKKEKAYTANAMKGSKAAQAQALQKRKKTIGKNLSFAAAEAYKLLRTNLIFSMGDEAACKIIGVTSSLRGEGKSSTSINLAYTIAETDQNVLLIEADMRLPVIAKTLRFGKGPGLSNFLAGVSQLEDAVYPSSLAKALFVLPAGAIPPNPSELLSSPRMGQMLNTLSQSFDYIIIDLPPINAVSDSLTISKLLSGMIMVVRQNYCDQRSLANAMRQMEFLKVKVLGFVMNDAEPDDNRYQKYGHKYKQGYSYGYRSPAQSAESAAAGEPSQKAGV